MDIIACGSRPSRKMGAPSFTGTVWQDPIIQAPDPARYARPGCASSRARARPGTRIRSGRRCTSPPASATCRPGAVRSAMSAPATRSGFRRAKSTGTARRPSTPWSTSPCRSQGGEHVKWLEPVTDEQYGKPRLTRRRPRSTRVNAGITAHCRGSDCRWRGDGLPPRREDFNDGASDQRAVGGMPGAVLRGAGAGATGQYELLRHQRRAGQGRRSRRPGRRRHALPGARRSGRRGRPRPGTPICRRKAPAR